MRQLTFICLFWLVCTSPYAQDRKLRGEAELAIAKAGQFFSDKVALNGGYVYFYSPDLSKRLGEGVASSTEIWVQPPGTPTVGLAFVAAYRATGNEQFLQAATRAAESLIYGQLKSGGWTSSVDFNPETARNEYRNGKGRRRGQNFSTLDDGTTQGAVRLLMQVDQVLEFNNRYIHEAVQIALDAMLKAQFTTGGFPQGWDEVPVQTQQPELTATYPDYDWQTEGRIKEYWDLYTLNDGAAGTIVETLAMAYDIYKADRYMQALERLGNFLIAAQMPPPQRGWAQQYNFRMQPVWARKFEPPAVAGRESQDVISALMKIHQITKNKKYLQPVPEALDYLESSALPDGRLARYYELESNRPLYMKRRGSVYSLTYDDSQLPGHYGWKVENRVSSLRAEYELLNQGQKPAPQTPVAENDIRKIIRSLDTQGRWVSTFAGERLIGQPKFRPGEQYISSEVFSDNITELSRFLRP